MNLHSIPRSKVSDTKPKTPTTPTTSTAPTPHLDDDVPRAVPHTESPAIKPPFDTKLHDFARLEEWRKLEISDFEAMADLSGRLVPWALEANACVRALLTKGSDAAPDAKLSPDDAQAWHAKTQNDFNVQLESSIAQREIFSERATTEQGKLAWKLNTRDVARLLSKQLQQHGFGGRSHQAAAAYGYLVQRVPKGTLVELCEFVGGDHELVVIGRRSGSDPKDITTWGPNAVVCDPWANKVYLLSQLARMQRPENDVKRFIGSCPDHYLKGRLQSYGEFYFVSMED